ncbi:MAG: hypothetical protein WC627_10490 [Legionella sp.]|jgi:hypothetical protein
MSTPFFTPVAVIIVAQYYQSMSINPELLTALRKANIKHIVLLPIEDPTLLNQTISTNPNFARVETAVIMDRMLRESTALQNKQAELAQSHSFIFANHNITETPKAKFIAFPTAGSPSNIPDESFMEKFKAQLKENSRNRYIIYNLHTDKVNIPSIAPNINVVNVTKNQTTLSILNETKLFRLRIACENYLAHLKQIPSEISQKCTNQTLTQDKIKIVQQLLELSYTPDSLATFENVFNDNRKKIEERRDSGTMIFLKILLSIFTGGFAPLCGLWRVEGKQVAQELASTLNPSL